jgi:uncharacterized RDD family membrane protein YckC
MSTICPLCQVSAARQPLYGEAVCNGCWTSFIVRRYLSFLFDLFVFTIGATGLLFAVAVMALLVGGEQYSNGPPQPTLFFLQVGLVGIFLLKDSFQGQSPGKLLFDLQVIDERHGVPASWVHSVSRNIPLFLTPAWVIMLFQIRRGPRWGDEKAGTRVIWRRHADHPLFNPHGAELADERKAVIGANDWGDY